MGMIESFTASQVLQVSGLTKRQLQLWVEDGWIVPSISRSTGTGINNLFSFADLVTIRALAQLREAGTTVQQLRKIAQRLMEYGGATFADTFVTFDGHDVALRKGEDLVSLLKNPHQTMFLWMVNMQPIAAQVRAVISLAPPKNKKKTAA